MPVWFLLTLTNRLSAVNGLKRFISAGQIRQSELMTKRFFKAGDVLSLKETIGVLSGDKTEISHPKLQFESAALWALFRASQFWIFGVQQSFYEIVLCRIFCANIGNILAIYWQYIDNTDYWQYIGARAANILLHTSNLPITLEHDRFAKWVTHHQIEVNKTCRMVIALSGRVHIDRS